jgi:hypothetical protein
VTPERTPSRFATGSLDPVELPEALAVLLGADLTAREAFGEDRPGTAAAPEKHNQQGLVDRHTSRATVRSAGDVTSKLTDRVICG